MEPCAAMESPLSATRSTCQLVLEHLCGVLLVIFGSWRCNPSHPVFSWAMLICTVVLVYLMKRQVTEMCEPLKKPTGSACHEVCGADSENIEQSTQANEVLRPL